MYLLEGLGQGQSRLEQPASVEGAGGVCDCLRKLPALGGQQGTRDRIDAGKFG